MEFDFRRIEEEYRKYWIENGVYTVTEDSTKPKYYVLDMFPYPSGAGLHVGHPLGYVASDIFSRYKRMKGFNVLHPMGFDAFGLPAEQYAIETGTHPQVTTDKAIGTYKEQLAKIGFSYDWTREVKTCDPDYYKWTQWIFLQLFDSWYNKESNKAEKIETLLARFEKENTAVAIDDQTKHWNDLTEAEKQAHLMHYRLAFQSYTEVNWCEALGCVLANDEVKDGKSERGGFPIERRKMKQWSLRITAYADRLLEGLETLEWSESMKEMQRNWIGRSEGALIDFKVKDREDFIKVFTTRADTIFGATFLVLSPEHELVEQLVTAEQKSTIDEYVAYVKSRSDVERQQEKKVTGAFTGAYALNPFNGTPIPIYIAEYVLAGYGTGAIMAVPADDERDKKFAEKFGLPVIEVIDKSMYPGATIEDKLGKMINSEFLNGMEVKEAIAKMLDEVESRNIGSRKVNYKLRDASFSRQRYWGEPIPVRYKVVGEPDSPLKGESDDIPYALSASELPLVLPEVDSFKPSGDGRSPLANNAEWVAKNYETDTMPGYAGSSWYFLRYMDPKNKEAFAAKDKLDYWQNVDLYLGGNEHAVGHLLYARLWTKVLHDLGYVPFDEPFKKLVNQGMIGGKSTFICRLSPVNGGKHIYVSYSLFSEIEIPQLLVGELKQFLPSNFVNRIIDVLGIEEGEKFNGAVYFDAFRVPTTCFNNGTLLIDELVEYNSDYKEEIFVFDTKEEFTYLPVFEKMSKSKRNVVNPDNVIEQHGADCFRMFEMFLGPLEQSKPWDDKGISGVSSFLRKFWRLFYSETAWKVTDETPTDKELKVLHKTIKKINEDVEKMSFNTSVSQFMITVNELQDLKCSKRSILEPLVLCLAPFAPFITEELWKALGNEGSVHQATFPALEEKYLVESEFEYPVSINGKTRASIALPADISQEDALAKVMEIEMVQKWMEGKPVKKFVFVKGRIVNIVV
jgi:leucyl-tRNA synthetase